MNNLPAHLLNRSARAAQVTQDSTHGMGAPPCPIIGINGNRFTLIDASGDTRQMPTMGPIFTTIDAQGRTVPVQGSPVGPYLDAVLVDVNPSMSKVFFPDPYSPNQQNYLPPVCWSDNGIGPSINAGEPQSLLCERCPNNVWGSKINNLGNKVKACDDVRKMAFYIPALGMKTLWLLRLKGSSFKNYRIYCDEVSKQRLGDRQLQVTDLVTRLYFDEGIGIVNFAWAGFIDAETAAVQEEVWASEGAANMLGMRDVPIAALPGPGAQNQNIARAGTPEPGGRISESPPQSFRPPPIPSHAPMIQSNPASASAPMPSSNPANMSAPPPSSNPNPQSAPPQPVWNAAAGRWELPQMAPPPAAPPPKPEPVWNPATGQWELPGGAALPAVTEAPKRRRGRPAAAPQAQPSLPSNPTNESAPLAPSNPKPSSAPAGFQGGEMPDLPGFLDRRNQQPQPDQPAGTNFGMRQPAPISQEAAAAVAGALNVPIPQ